MSIEELIALGEKATQGEWTKRSGVYSDVGYVDGNYLKAVDLFDGPEAEFVKAAANARPAIKAMHEENKRLREAVRDMALTIGVLRKTVQKFDQSLVERGYAETPLPDIGGEVLEKHADTISGAE